MLRHTVLGLIVVLTMGAMQYSELNDDALKPSLSDSNALNALTEEDLATMMQRYTAYNHWANQQFVEWLRSASEEDMTMEMVSSYSTIKETILHIWGGEYLWLQVIKDEPKDNSPARNFDGSKDELLDGWLTASENFRDHVASMSLEELQVKRARSRGDGHTLIADMIQHCMNHSTSHRGQLITMGRQAGLTDVPRTDFIYYVGLPED